MNTVQKAQAWLARPIPDGHENYAIRDANKVILALLAERDRYRKALVDIDNLPFVLPITAIEIINEVLNE